MNQERRDRHEHALFFAVAQNVREQPDQFREFFEHRLGQMLRSGGHFAHHNRRHVRLLADVLRHAANVRPQLLFRRCGLLHAFAHALREGRECPFEDFGVHLFFAADVIVNRGFIGLRLFRNFIHARALVAEFGKDAHGRV